ncbi:protein kinase domain-containing protein [Polyangium sorediatum]|uniref:Protein kinase n=1 Tax=Polyangium sorediatum TaxID=889274 RepID=A0ABT6NI83_9BACT|nr:protein kinase [Polyangium sorediatum]MDI1428020.1 protein kinase [Polyangium sorediatum]
MSHRLIAGKYELVRQIGRGAMGYIWEGLDLHLRRRVALKLMSPDHVASTTARTRFDREAKAIAQLRNQHVVQIYDYGIDEGSPYIVMELLEGEDFESRLERIERLPLSALVPIVTQAAIGLAAAHAKGIVHRDFKPANVFMSRGEANETVKILDFGVVSMLTSEEDATEDELQLTHAGSIVGTPLYMSPEQIRCGAVDLRSDLWSLAVLAYRALTGQHPFPGQWLGMLMVRICTDPFPPPSTYLKELTPEVDRFFERALAKDPDKRFRSAREFASAFAALAEHNQPGTAKILVVDDEPDVPHLIKQRFRQQIKKEVYTFVFATNGESALEELRKHGDIDVVLTDINMPGMDGLTFLSRVGDVNPLVRTIIVSAYGDMSNIRTAMNRGAFDFLVKPIDFKDLEVTIEKTLKHVTELRTNARSSEENSVLRMFVSPSLVDRLRSASSFGAIDTWQGTVVFIDVAGFHASSKSQEPNERVRTLNANFEVIVPAVTNRGGVVDKFLGDAVMATFRGDHHVTRALEASLDVRMQLRTLALRAGQDSPFALGVSIGVATGDMLSGEIGSKAFGRLDYTIVGEVPRAAAMLQAAATKNQILMNRGAFDVAKDSFDCVPVHPATSEPLEAFELVRRAGGDTIGGRGGPNSMAETIDLTGGPPGGNAATGGGSPLI